jgi:pyridoxine 4-dehydrogenase
MHVSRAAALAGAVSVIRGSGFPPGAMRLAGPNVWGPPDDPESARQILRLAAELGVTFFDTANACGPRTVNQLIGQALRPFPEG